MFDTKVMDMETDSAMGVIALMSMKGFGRAAVQKVLATFPTIGDLLQADDEKLKACLNVKQREAIRDPALFDEKLAYAAREVENAVDSSVAILTLNDVAYPSRLKTIEEPPFVLYALGDISVLDRSIAVIGTRDPTRFGQQVAGGMASAASRDGWCVVSGLARGVDTIAHEAALDAGMPTCAVLGSAVDVYEHQNSMDLARRIYEGGGLILSEQPLGTRANMGSYIHRDRIISGVSAATFFVQGEMSSGSMHTVRYAIGQGRRVYVPEIPEKFMDEPINHTARDMARMKLSQFAKRLEWSGSAADAGVADPDRTVAVPIMNRDDYPRVFDEIRSVIEGRPQFGMDLAATF